MYEFRGTVAIKYGITAAIIAEFLWDKVNNKNDKNVYMHDNKVWCRCSIVMITGEFPFLTNYQVKHAIKILRDKGIVKRDCYNENKFDHTNWYAFTETGSILMKKK